MNLSIFKQVLLLRKKSVIALALVFLLSLALQVFVSLYQSPKLEKTQLELQKHLEAEGRGVSLQSRDTIYRNGLADLDKFYGRIYLKSHFARFISELFTLAEKNSLELSAISYKPTLNNEEQLLEYQLTVSVSGKYLNLKRFINDLGSSANIVVIDSISLASNGPSADTVQLQIQLTSLFRMEGK